VHTGGQFQFQATASGLDSSDCCFPDGKRQQVRIRFR
jgi:hypothetical protein